MPIQALQVSSPARYQEPSLFYKMQESLNILFTDLIPSNITCILPNAVSWAYRTFWTRSIQSYTLTTTKTGYLFAHNIPKLERPNSPVSAILLLHGERSHPLTMLHLADIAQAQGKAVFSVYLPYEDEHPEGHRSLLRKSIDKIDQIIAQKGGRLTSLCLAGHSRGSIEAVHETYVENNPQVNGGVIAIAGRFKVIEPSLRPCRKSLQPAINTIWKRLCGSFRSLQTPFYQIAAKHDWCIDPEASIVRFDQKHLSVNASHLGVIHHPDTLKQFKTWIKTPFSKRA